MSSRRLVVTPDVSQVLSRDEFDSNIKRITGWKKDSEGTTASGVKGVLHIDSRSLRDGLVEVTAGALDDMKSALAKRAASATAELLSEARANIKWLDERPTDLDDFARYKAEFPNVEASVKTFYVRMEDVVGKQDKAAHDGSAASKGKDARVGMYEILKIHEYKLPIQDQVALDNLEEEKFRLDKSLVQGRMYLSSVQQQQNAMLTQDVSHLQEDLLDSMAVLATGPLLSVQSDTGEMLAMLEEMKAKIEQFEHDAERFCSYQELFKMPQDNFGNLELVKKDFTKHQTLWASLHEWKQLTTTWLSSKTNEIDLEDLQTRADEYARSAYKMSKTHKVG